MNHPTREAWMDYLYDELPPDQRAPLAAHLESCTECRAQVASWHGAKVSLDEWQLPARQPKREPAWVPLRWAAAAALMIGLGFVAARWTAPAPDMTVLRADLQREVRAQVRRQLDTEFQTARAHIVDEARQQWQAELEELQAQRVADYAALRKGLETVAVNAESGFESAQEQIGQLIAFTQPAISPDNSK
jgi:anti-sigma factor RsiW